MQTPQTDPDTPRPTGSAAVSRSTGPAAARPTGSAVARWAGTAGVVGGLALFADLGLHAFGALTPVGYAVVASATAVALAATPWALRAAGAVAARGRVLASAGTVLVTIGAGLWIAAFVGLALDPATAFTQRLTPTGSAMLALGMVLVGAGVLRSRVLTGWRGALPLLVGLYFPAQLVAQLVFFLGGRDASPGPNGLLLGAWGLLWAATGLVVVSGGAVRAGSRR